MISSDNLQPKGATPTGNSSPPDREATSSIRQTIALTLFWVGAAVAVGLAILVGRSLVFNLRTLTMDELSATVFAEGGPLYIFWALSVTIGSVLVGIGATVYVKSMRAFAWFIGIVVPSLVIVMVMVWTRVYIPMLFGIGGSITLLAFFAIVWIWMKKYAALGKEEKVAGGYKLIGYIFWINATWFLCGETGKLHLKVFEGSAVPSPIEVMVFLVLGWLFVLAGEYKSRHLSS
jgi:hypothetical protein